MPSVVIAMTLFLHLLLFASLCDQLAIARSLQFIRIQELRQKPDECGSIQIPFPFYLNASHPPHYNSLLSRAFCLSCVNSSSLFLSISSVSYRILRFFPDGILVDFPNSPTCRRYDDLKSFTFTGNEFFGISSDNVLDLYDCEDSSLCRAECEKSFVMPGCNGKPAGNPACCYPLSDHIAYWSPLEQLRQGLSVFSKFGCRGFSSWVVLPGSNIGQRGVKLEWAVPRNLTDATTCATNADLLNATSVIAGVRCQCGDGFVGDGFNAGVGCLKSCFKDGKEVYGKDCYPKSHGGRKEEILTGVLTSGFTIASLTALFCLLKRPAKSDIFDHDQACCQDTYLSRKECRSQLFTYQELEEAAKGFDDGYKIVEGIRSTLYAGFLGDGTHLAIQRIQCVSERDLIQVLSRVEALSHVTHKNMAHLLGWSVNSGFTPLVVYEYPENGTLEENLNGSRNDKSITLDWHKRLKIVAETASVLALLHHEISPPIFHHDVGSRWILLDEEFSAKLSGFELLGASANNEEEGEEDYRRSDVYCLGVLLLEVITGVTSSSSVEFSSIALQKIKGGRIEEIVDPRLYYHEQPAFGREQIDKIADLATRCLLFGGSGKFGMVDVAGELLRVKKESVESCSRRAPALEETFSNSSLLQMISMSPDSIYVP